MTYVIDADRCIACGLSSSLVPELIQLDEAAIVVRQPESAKEREQLEAAMALCPVNAIAMTGEANV